MAVRPAFRMSTSKWHGYRFGGIRCSVRTATGCTGLWLSVVPMLQVVDYEICEKSFMFVVSFDRRKMVVFVGNKWHSSIKSLRRGWHNSNGSPMKPGEQLQIGLWLITWHSAFKPHVPRSHGFWHFCWMQAACWSHSELVTHSGRQFGGEPIKPNWHEQVGRSPITRQMLFGPHGDGSHGFCGTSAVGGQDRNK